MKTSNKPAQTKLTNSTDARKDERGSVMVVALMCLLALFALTIAATKIRVASARDIEDKTAQATQYWDARSGAATVEASLTTDIPSIFDAEMLRAQNAVGGYPLPAFDPPQIASNYSRPVLNPDGTINNSNASQCTSLLGNLNAWAQRKTSIAETYASEKGYGPEKARVAVFQESLRQQLVGGSVNSEPAYLLEYQIDSAVGQQGNARGRVRPSGTIMLGPAQPGCNTTVSLTAAPADIALGASSTLTVTYTNASHVWITDETGAIVPGTDTSGLAETSGEQTLTFDVSPIDNTSYRAQAEGSGCRAVSAEVTVIVNYPPPEIIQFNAIPACINRGQSATLTYQVRYASSINIAGGGINQTVPGNSGATITSGTLVVSPIVDTTYTLTATGRGGSSTRTTSVTVKQPFSIDQFISNTYCVIPGNPVNLTWAATNGETATITDSTTGTAIGVTPSGGTRSFTVNSNTTFTLSVSRTGCSGVETLTKQLTINTSPVPTSTFGANPSTIELGNTTTLQWTSTNASTVTITPSPVAGSGMSGPQTVSPSGSFTITPTAINQNPGYTYTLTVTNNSCSTQTVTKTANVKVGPVFVPPPCPNVLSLTADSCVASGGNSTLRWNVADSDFVTITGPGVNQTFSSSPVGTGSLVVAPTANSTYTLTATRTGSCTPGSPPFPTTATVNVQIGQTPTVTNFTASPAAIDAGQTTRLTWNESGNLASVRVTGSGGDTGIYNVPPGQRFLDVRPPSTSTYTVTVTSNSCSATTANQATTVTVGACPQIVSPFSANPTNIIQGSSSTLQWGINNASQVLLDGTPVASSGTRVVSPNVTTTYRLSAISNNGSCNTDQFVTVTVASCPTPQILSFTATPNSLNAGSNQMIRLAWNISDSSSTGVSVSILPNVGAGLPASGFVDLSPPAATTTYTLTATNGCGKTSNAPVVVTIVSALLCSGAPGSNDFQIGIGLQDRSSTVAIQNSFQPNEPLILVWTTRNANPSTVRINGNLVTPSGEMEVTQGADGNYSWTITAENLDGSRTLSRSVTTSILTTQGMLLCPVVPDFYTNTPAVNAGSSFTYFWDRKNYGTINSACWTDSPPTAGSGTAQARTGSLTITPDWYSPICVADTIGLKKYGATAYNNGNPDVCIRDNWFVLQTLPPAGCGRIYSFNAGPQIVAQPGVPIQLNWSIDPGATVTINNGVGNVSNASSVTLVAPAADTVYTITATWPGGCQQQKSTRVIVHQKGWVLSSSSAGAISSVFVEGDMTNNPDGSVTVTVQAVGLGLGGEFQSPSARLQLFGPDGSAFYDQNIVNWQLVPGLGQGITYTVTVPASAIPLSSNPACQPPIDMRIDAVTPFVLFFSTTLHHTSLDTREPDGFPVQDESIPDASYSHQAVRAKP